MRGFATGLLATMALALVTACASSTGGGASTKPAPAGAKLAGDEWKIFEINGAGIAPHTQPTINFADGRVYGAGSCNRYMGSYTAGDAFEIKLGQMASTMMACPDPAMQQEGKLLKVLEGVTSYSVSADGVLTLSTADGQTIKARR